MFKSVIKTNIFNQPQRHAGRPSCASWLNAGGYARLNATLNCDSSNMAGQEDPVQREIHQDWANREYIEVITSSIKKIADFLNSFGKLVHGERKETSIDVLSIANRALAS